MSDFTLAQTSPSPVHCCCCRCSATVVPSLGVLPDCDHNWFGLALAVCVCIPSMCFTRRMEFTWDAAAGHVTCSVSSHRDLGRCRPDHHRYLVRAVHRHVYSCKSPPTVEASARRSVPFRSKVRTYGTPTVGVPTYPPGNIASKTGLGNGATDRRKSDIRRSVL